MDVSDICQLHLYQQELRRYVMARSGSYDCENDPSDNSIKCGLKTSTKTLTIVQQIERSAGLANTP